MNQEKVKEAVKQEARASACCGGEPAVEPEASSPEQIKEIVKERYGAAARIAAAGGRAACGPIAPATSGGCCSGTAADFVDPVTRDLYGDGEKAGLPQEAVLASLGCGNPTALAQLSPGETVLDLGSGGGIDVLLSARRVGPTGKAYGLDMTDDMLALARENQRKAGVTNIEFL
jgi:arsenite methyltransferase